MVIISKYSYVLNSCIVSFYITSAYLEIILYITRYIHIRHMYVTLYNILYYLQLQTKKG